VKHRAQKKSQARDNDFPAQAHPGMGRTQRRRNDKWLTGPRTESNELQQVLGQAVIIKRGDGNDDPWVIFRQSNCLTNYLSLRILKIA
jgi:hypothetical protein